MSDSQYKLKKKAALISLSVGIGMFLAKMGAYYITGSAAIFSDAAESVVHVLATSMALYSIMLSSKPADRSHLYGHGNIEYFSAGIEGFLIVAAALYIMYEAVTDIIAGPQLESLGIGVLIISGAGGINLMLGFYLIRIGKKTNSLTLIADGKHVLTDSYTSIGVIIGISLVMITGFELLDPLFAIAVAVNILITGFKLMRQSVGGLMNETDEKLLDKISNMLIDMRRDYWIDLHELRFWTSGDKIFLDFHLIIPYYFTIKESHAEEHRIRDIIRRELPNTEIRIHFDYCIPELCKFCDYAQCSVREEEKKEFFNWDIKKLTGPPIYKIN